MTNTFLLPFFPRKPYPTPDQNGQNLYSFSDRKGAKNTLWGGTYLYDLYKEVTPGVIL